MNARSTSVSLVGALVLALLLELLTRRIGVRLAGDLMLPRQVQEVLGLAGSFSFHLASLLSVLLAGLAVMRLLAQPALLPAGARPLEVAVRAATVVALVGFVFIAVLGVWQPLPGQLRLYLVLLFAMLVAQMVRGGWSSTVGRGRVRLWLGLLLVAVVAHLTWMALKQLAPERLPGLQIVVLTVGEASAVTAAAAAPFCLLTRRSPRLWPLVAGALVTAAATALAARDWTLAMKVAAYGFGVQLPMPMAGVMLEAVALGSWVAATLALLAEAGTPRLRGWGLALLGLSGYQLELPYQVCSSLLGVLCIVESYLRERAVVLPQESWQQMARRLARMVGTTEVITVGAPGFEQARVNGSVDGEAAELLVERRSFLLARVELAIGDAPADEAPELSLLRRGMPRLGRRDGVEVATGDLDFDATFVIHDARRLAAADPVLDDERRPRLRRAIDGWLGVWPGRGARLRSTGAETFNVFLDETAGGDEVLRGLLSLLIDIKRRG